MIEKFTKNDFLNALKDIQQESNDFITKVYVSNEQYSHELVFCLNTNIPNLTIKIFSTIPTNKNIPRDVGLDAIRVIPFLNNKPYYMIEKLSRVNRTINWKKNISNRINKIQDNIQQFVCPNCKNLLLKRKNKQGIYFVGCSNFPVCTYTKKI